MKKDFMFWLIKAYNLVGGIFPFIKKKWLEAVEEVEKEERE